MFVGPSLEASRAAALLPDARIEPPAGRGDVARLVTEGVGLLVLIDGAFGHRLAVSPGEIVDALRAGARIVGAASLGAVRAAECHPAGMEGVGAVAALFRLGVLTGDDEVAVAVEPERGHRASSVALINVRFAVLTGLRQGLLDRTAVGALLSAAKGLHFSEREWGRIFAIAGVAPGPALASHCRATDVKRRDAERAVGWAASQPAHDAGRGRGSAGSHRSDRGTGRRYRGTGRRYLGHDRLLGLSVLVAAVELARWLAGSGRYRRHAGLHADAEPVEVWARLEREGELELELMRWHAVSQLAGRRASADGEPLGPFLAAARADVAAAHGFADWAALEPALAGDSRFLARVRAAAHALALARRNGHYTRVICHADPATQGP